LKKVLFIAHSAERSGATVVLIRLVTSLDKSKCEATIVFPEDSDLTEELRHAGVHVLVIPNPQEGLVVQRNIVKAARLILSRCRYGHRLHRLCRSGNYDLVYINSLISIFPGISAFLSGKRVLWHIHETFPRTVNNRLKAWLIKRWSDAIVFASPTCRPLFEPIPRRIDAEFIPNGLALEPYRNQPRADHLYNELKIARDCTIITSIGYIHRIKGIDLLLKSLPRILREIPNAHFLIVGDRSKAPKEYDDLLKNIIENTNVGEHVTFTGERRDIPQLLSITHLFVLPSRMESFPVVLLEAMAAETPVVATRVGCVEEILDFGKAGYVVAPDDPEQLSHAVADLLKNRSLSEQLVRHASQRVKDEYSLDRFVDRIQRIVDKVSA
jgi:glycosyltransferase involved in cell wall biosynthesis